jgi:5-methylcytosine-specific restriction endonuclease McrA
MAHIRDWKRERSLESPAYKKSRLERKRARYHYMVELAKKVGIVEAKRRMAGMDLDHKHPLAQGGSNTSSNLRLRSVHSNRADKGSIFKGKRTTRPKHPQRN